MLAVSQDVRAQVSSALAEDAPSGDLTTNLTVDPATNCRAELRAKASNAMIPDAAALTEGPVKPGQEQEFIESLKQIFRKMEANPEAVQAALGGQMGKRTKKN